MGNNKLYRCTNIAFAAFLEMHGHKVSKLEVPHQGKGVFWFDINESDLNTLRVGWNASKEAEFNDRLNRLKSLTY